MMLILSTESVVPDDEIQISAIRAQGPGGQNVNKVATAVLQRFDIAASSLPDTVKDRLLALPDRRITREGVIIIKVQQSRSRDSNRETALARLRDMIQSALLVRKTRKPTKPKRCSQKQRLDRK